MCNNSSLRPPDVVRTRSMINKKATTTSTKSLKPTARKTRTKTRKPKYLSLRLELSQHNQTPKCSEDMTGNHQLNLFPLHPGNMVDDKLLSDINDDNNVAYLFHAEGGGTLNGLLTTTTTSTVTTTPATTMSSEEDSMSYAYSYRAQDQCSEEINDYKAKCLVRTAMRNRERDMSEEKWVCYSEVVEKKEVEEVTSSDSGSGSGSGSDCVADDLWFQSRSTKRSLALKLDYQGILNAWSDKGPLYIHAHGDLDASPQTVPDLHDDKSSNVLMDGLDMSSAGNVWRVPDNGGNVSSVLKIKEEVGGKDDWKMGQREASLLRYKKKRQSRLFSKRIRYEVRKLNAEKRPRMKGRFVKRS